MTVPYVFVPRNFNNMRRANGFGDVSRRRHHNVNAVIGGGGNGGWGIGFALEVIR